MSEEKKKFSNEEMESLDVDLGFSDEGEMLSKEELVVEAKRIMKEVNSDQKVVNRPLPLNLRENIDKRIMALGLEDEEEEAEAEVEAEIEEKVEVATAAEAKTETGGNVEATTAAEVETSIGANVAEHVTEGERFSAEEKELLRLGKLYKKKRRMRKYLVLVAAVVCALAFGVTSMGGPKRVYESFQTSVLGRDRTGVDTGEKTEFVENVSEEEAFQQIEDEFDFYPVKPIYKPDGVEVLEMNIGEEVQGIDLLYGKDDEVIFSYFIRPNYRNGSYGTDIEDDVINKYTVQNGNVDVVVKQYSVEDNNNRWSGEFVYQDVHYFIVATDIGQEEFEKIVKNLNFY